MAEPPLNEYEQRFFLAEILKSATVPPSEIFQFIVQRDIKPQWDAMALPIGRSINSCRANYTEMLGFGRGQVRQPEFAGVTAPSPLRNPRSSIDQGEVIGQRGGPKQSAQATVDSPGLVTWNLAPQHPPDFPLKGRPNAPDQAMHPHVSQFPAVNDTPSTPRAYLTGPEVPPRYGSDRKGKKRGRPSKADYEIRAAEARARGDPWPPPKKTKVPRTSTEGLSGLGDTVDATTSKIKSGRKSVEKPVPGAVPGQEEITEGQGASRITAGGTLSPEEEIQLVQKAVIGSPGAQQKSTIPETQASEFPATESLIAGMQEPAGPSAPAARAEDQTLSPENLPTQNDTTPSSVTFKQSSTPQTLPRSNLSRA